MKRTYARILPRLEGRLTVEEFSPTKLFYKTRLKL